MYILPENSELFLFVVKDKGIDVHICRKFRADDFLQILCHLTNYFVHLMYTLMFI